MESEASRKIPWLAGGAERTATCAGCTKSARSSGGGARLPATGTRKRKGRDAAGEHLGPRRPGGCKRQQGSRLSDGNVERGSSGWPSIHRRQVRSHLQVGTRAWRIRSAEVSIKALRFSSRIGPGPERAVRAWRAEPRARVGAYARLGNRSRVPCRGVRWKRGGFRRRCVH